MKEYNCPDCQRTDNCDGCPRTTHGEKQLFIPRDFPDSKIWPVDQYVPNCCKHCSNHPSNGGEGICCCSLPTMYEGRTNGNW